MSCPEHAEYPIRGVASPRTVRRPGVSCEGQMAQSRRNVGGGPSVGHVSPPTTCPRRVRAGTRGPSRPAPCQRGGDHVGRARRRDGRGRGGGCDDHRRPPGAAAVARHSGARRDPSIPSGISNIGGASGVAVIACSLLAWSAPIVESASHCVHAAARRSGGGAYARRAAAGCRTGGRSGLVIFVTRRGFATFHAIRGARQLGGRGRAASPDP